MNISVFYQVYKNKKATEFVLQNFRKYFSDNKIVLISDGGDNFFDLKEKYNCEYFEEENIFGNEVNKYPKYPYNSYRMLKWWERQKLVCDITNSDYTMILEDDVLIQNKFEIKNNFSLMGVRVGCFLSDTMIKEIKEKGKIDVPKYGMCGGSVYNSKIFLNIYDDVINDIKTNHDYLVNNFNEYYLLGATDANITYHFGKRGYKYEIAPWLSETIEENWEQYPIVHNYKEYYYDRR